MLRNALNIIENITRDIEKSADKKHEFKCAALTKE